MIIGFFLLCFWALYTFLLTYFVNSSLPFIILWIFVGLLIMVVSTVFTFYCILLPIFSKTKGLNKFQHFVLRQFLDIGLIFTRSSYKIIDKHKLVPIGEGPQIFVGNHKSNLDALFFYSAIKRPATAVAKSDLANNKIYYPIMKAYKVIAIDRDNDRKAAADIIKGIKLVKEGLPIVIFPEGGVKTREIEQMVELRAGAYKLATKSKATIQPIVVKGASKIKGRKPFSWSKVTLQILDPIRYEEYEKMNTTELGLMIAERINDHFPNEEKVEIKLG